MTKRVLLLLTGDCERGGFPSALTAEFAPRADVTFDAYGDVFHSATSASVGIDRLAGQPSASGRGPVDKLASALIDAGLRCDLAIAIDDLELVNAGRADSVKAFFGAAVARETQRLGLTHPQVQRIAQRCSFHLLAPMVEAYFFGEHAAIDRALATAGAPTGLLWSTFGSLEDFTTLDAAYCDRELAPDLARSDRKDDKTLAWRAGNREKHPKHYLEFLCRSAPQGY